VLTNLRRVRFGLAASCVLSAVVAAAWVAGPAAAAPAGQAAQAAQTAHAAQATPATTAASSGIPTSAKNQLTREMTAALQLTDGHGVTVALLDTLVSQISELNGKLTVGPNYAPLRGSSTADGTVIASLIAGSGTTTTNPYGTEGTAPGARILSEGILDQNTNTVINNQFLANGTWQGLVAQAIRYAVDHGASVIVVDESGDINSDALDSAVAYAASKKAVVIGSAFAASGTSSDLEYPDSLPGVINFSGTTISGLPGPQTHERYAANASVLIAAPDNQLDATGPGNQPYQAWSYDTAVAWVAGTVAMIKSLYPQISPAMVATALATSASYHPAGGYNTTIGYGLINPLGALQEAANLVKVQATAKPGAGVASATARFGTAQPATIRAVHHATAKLAGFGGAIVVGAVLLVLAFWLRARGRRRAAAGRHSAGLGFGPPPALAGTPPDWPGPPPAARGTPPDWPAPPPAAGGTPPDWFS
jgi:hypothetical protein